VIAIQAPTIAPPYPVRWPLGLPFVARNLVLRWRDLLGMMLGVGIALGMGMTLLGVNSARQEIITGDFKKAGTDVYVVSEGGTMVPILPSDTPGTIKHAAHVLAQVRAQPTVRSAIGVMTFTMTRDLEGPRRPDQPTEIMSVMGVDGDPAGIPNQLVINDGRWLRRTGEIVLGPRLAKEKRFVVGDALRLNGRAFTIVGIGKLRGLGYGFSGDTQVYMDYGAFRQRADVGDLLTFIAVSTSSRPTAMQQIRDLGSLSVYSLDDLLGQLDKVNASGTVIYWIMIVLTLSIAGLFVSTVLNHSVATRRLEFATLRAIGLPQRTILTTVAVEATAISLVAGVIGVGISLFLGGLTNALAAPQFGFDALYVADAGLFELVFALALGLGLVAGLVPARRATRVDPVDVLREA
jgi:putative ABC transport system permease protein